MEERFDIYRHIASQMLNIPYEAVTPKQRAEIHDKFELFPYCSSCELDMASTFDVSKDKIEKALKQVHKDILKESFVESTREESYKIWERLQ